MQLRHVGSNTFDVMTGNVHQQNLIDLLVADKRSKQTKRAYRNDIKMFFVEMFPGVSENVAMETFLNLTQHEAIIIGLRYKEQMQDRLTSASINRRLSALRSLVSLARKLGRCSFHLVDVKNDKVKPYRDTSGLTVDQFKLVLFTVQQQEEEILKIRDTAILRLLWSNALRRFEIAALNVKDFDCLGKRIKVLGKGQDTPEWLEAPAGTVAAIQTYLNFRGLLPSDAPLFVAHDFKNQGHRLTGDMYSKLVKKYCERAGIAKRVSAHTLRHSSITAALDLTDGNIRKVQKMSRHKDPRTVMIYDDNRHRHQGEVADLLDLAL